MGTKISLIKSISRFTNIREDVISDNRNILVRSVSERMTWAAPRQTTRIEDEAYCLLGIFNIHLPLLYGEGRMAFRRLQEEIVKRNTDLTIFYWDDLTSDSARPQYMDLFAESPRAFSLAPFPTDPFSQVLPEFFITNKGVSFSGIFHLSQVQLPGENVCKLYCLMLGTHSAGILLRKIGPGIFCRDGRSPINLLNFRLSTLPDSTSSFYVLADPTPTMMALVTKHRNLTLRVPHNQQFQLADAIPDRLWDATDRVFLSAPRNAQEYFGRQRYPVILAMAFQVQIARARTRLVVLCQDARSGPRGNCRIFRTAQYQEQASFLFGVQNREQSIQTSDFERLMPDIASLGNCVEVELNNRTVRISVSVNQGTLEIMSDVLSVWDLVFEVSSEKQSGRHR
jgi:hypothetical protein